MANTTLTASIVAKASLAILENELTMANAVYRGYEGEFDKKINGYEVGDTITIRKPTDFTVRSTITASAQDVTEAKTTIQVNSIAGVDFAFTSQQLTQNIGELSERVIRPAMIQIANQIDVATMNLYKDIPQWVGTPGTLVQSFAGFAKGAQNLDQRSVPQDSRSAILAPADFWALAGSQTALYSQAINNKSYREGEIGKIGGINTFMSQNAPTFTTGPMGGTPLVNGASQNTTYDTTGANTQTLITDGWTAAAAARVVKGDVFTIAGVYDVNPVTKATLPILKQFVVVSNGSSDGSGNLTLTIAPQIITSGAFQTVSAAPADNAAMTFVGTANTGYTNNLFFHKNAFALCTVPMVKPPGAVDCSRQSKNGLSVRVIPFYDGTNDKSTWRLDVLYGVKTIDPRLAVRVSGT
ncbi:P22 phage major capsid protein family protein [Afipia sp. DC4300-2b1]|uniref:P22 phage major capsid protein family protein n=1 Tax=Afipia sp. DC4300-2b1 TaxID=2804672 RepID=UPI003CEDBBB1